MPKRTRDKLEYQDDESELRSELEDIDSASSSKSSSAEVLGSELQDKLLNDKQFLLAFSKRLQAVKVENVQRYEWSVVDITSYGAVNNFAEPWLPASTSKWTGSGFIINYKGNNFIITNAHVAEMASTIEVRLADEAKKYVAKVKHIEHDCDLACLQVKDREFWKKVKPLKLGEMPTMRSHVAVVGFPSGGEELCITDGKVSRIEVSSYCHSGVDFLNVQVSAAINPGNSGGPAINPKGEVVGVAFQIMGGEGMGYIIPVPILAHFLDDVLNDDRPYQGFPDWAFNYQSTQNKCIKDFYSLKDDIGVIIVKVNKLTGLANYLQRHDILVELDGVSVKDDGTIETSYSKRLDLSFLLTQKHIGETTRTTVIRDGKRLTFDIPMLHRANTHLIVGEYKADLPPTFYINCGVVLQPLSAGLIDELSDPEFESFLSKEKKHLGEEVVIITEIFATKHTKGLHPFTSEIVTHINGVKVRNLREIITEIEKCEFGDTYEIKTAAKHVLRLTRLTEQQNHKLLKPYRVTRLCSEDLLQPAIWRPGCPEYYAQQGLEQDVAVPKAIDTAAIKRLKPNARRPLA